MTMIETLSRYFSYPAVSYIFVTILLISLCSALFGVILVLKRFSFIGDGLSHVAFGAVAVSAVLKVDNDLIVVLPLTVAAAVLILVLGQRAKIKGDAAIAMLSVGSLAIGYLLLSRFSGSGNISGDVCNAMFGSSNILTIKSSDVLLCSFLALAVMLFFVFFYHRIFAITFDESFSRATGIRTSLYNILLSVTIAVIIVIAMELIGSLLISALIVFPSLSAMRIFKSFKSVIICSALSALLCAATGFLVSLMLSLPVGATVVSVNILQFLIFSFLGRVLKRT